MRASKVDLDVILAHCLRPCGFGKSHGFSGTKFLSSVKGVMPPCQSSCKWGDLGLEERVGQVGTAESVPVGKVSWFLSETTSPWNSFESQKYNKIINHV
jgi:hypothetical protein